MGSLNTSLLIGLQALEVTQGALTATSNNISNADTPGYTREVVQLSENKETVSGSQVNGGGVTLDGVQSVRDELLNLQILQQTALQNSADTQSSSLSEVQNSFTTNGSDIASAISAFSSALTQLSATPTDASARASVLAAGQNLAQAFNTTASGLSSVQTEANAQVTQTVAKINTLTTQIAQLNGQVAQLTAAGKDGGTVEDQRDALVQQLSTLTGVSITQSSDGETITTANGSPLVMGSQSYALATTAGSDGMAHVIDTGGNDITSQIQGGELGGAITVRDQTIPGFESQLDTLATQFAGAFNTAQAEGYDANGNAGQDFFTFTSGASAAAGICVGVTDPALIAASSDGSSGSNGNVANLSAALTGPLASGQSASSMYANLVYQVGAATSNANTQSTAIAQNLQQLTNQQGSVSGVSIDEETTNLIRYQTAYEAAARIINTIQQLNTVTLDMGSSQSY